MGVVIGRAISPWFATCGRRAEFPHQTTGRQKERTWSLHDYLSPHAHRCLSFTGISPPGLSSAHNFS